MLILPPFQGEGHGAQLLEAVHRFYCGLPKVQDITGERFWFLPSLSLILNVCRCLSSAEDPSENYVKLRDFVLSKLCQSLPAFTVDKLPRGFSDEMVKEAQDKLKINKVWYRSAADDYCISALMHCNPNFKIYWVFFFVLETREARV